MDYKPLCSVKREREGRHAGGWGTVPGHRLGPAVRSLVPIPVLKLRCSPFKKCRRKGWEWGGGGGGNANIFTLKSLEDIEIITK